MATLRKHLTWLTAATASAAALLLAACGGGGGDSGETTPLPSSSNLSQSTAEAQQAADFSVKAAAYVVSTTAVVGNPLVDLRTPGALMSAARPEGRRSALASSSGEGWSRALANLSMTASCIELNVFTGPCTGSTTIETNLSSLSTNVIPADTFMAMSFSNLGGKLDGDDTLYNGQFRIDFLTAMDLNATSFANIRFRIATTNFSAKYGGLTIGPDTSSLLVEFDAASVPTYTIGNNVITKISGLDITDAGNFSIGSVQLRRPYWGAGTNNLDSALVNWRVSQGRPAVGSVANLTASNGTTAKIEVASYSATTVVYAVQITAGGNTKRYTVTATYGANGAPTYTAVEI